MGYNRTANAFYYLLTLYTYSAYVKTVALQIYYKFHY